MKKMMTVIMLSTILLTSCGTTKNIEPCCKEEPKKEVISKNHDPIMKLLLSGLIILSVNFLFTK
jgi:hypothetical protein|tara:strand:- start:916 stop:1107 length:192 start_codon:yes stop_codon:yes gene_type:complete